MTITLEPHSTVLFAGEWCFRHPGRPITWIDTADAGHTVTDLEARWQTDVLDARPDVVSILVGVNDNGRHTFDPRRREVSADEFAAGYDRLLAPLAEAGAELILIEPFLLPVEGVTEAGHIRIDADVRRDWRAGLTPKIQAVRHLAVEYGAHLIAADRMFAELSAETGPEHWSEDGVHPTPAGHCALAKAWLRLVS